MDYFQIANNYYNDKDYDKAFEFYEKSAQAKKYEASSLYNASVCLIKLKKYNLAIAKLKEALMLKKDSKYYFNLGYCYTILKDNKKALLYFNNAWCLDNNDSDCEKALNIITKNLRKKGNIVDM